MLDYPAAQLFAERPAPCAPGLLFDADQPDRDRPITRSLDGIPLALELAAARVSTLSPVEVSATARAPVHPAHLRGPDRRGTAADAARHRRLELPAAHRDGATGVRPALGVPGRLDPDVGRGCRRRRGRPPGEVLDTVGRLVERSMVVVEPGPTTRYRMLETLRQYAAERLAGVRRGGRGGAPPRRLLPQHRRARRSGAAWARGSGRRCGRCATSNRTSAPPWRGSAAPTATATPPEMAGSSACSGTSAATSKAATCCPAGRGHARGRRRRGHGAASGLHRRTAPRLPGAPQPPVRRNRAGEPGPVRGARRRLARGPVPGPPRRRRRHRRRTGAVAGAAGSCRGAVQPRR